MPSMECLVWKWVRRGCQAAVPTHKAAMAALGDLGLVVRHERHKRPS